MGKVLLTQQQPPTTLEDPTTNRPNDWPRQWETMEENKFPLGLLLILLGLHIVSQLLFVGRWAERTAATPRQQATHYFMASDGIITGLDRIPPPSIPFLLLGGQASFTQLTAEAAEAKQRWRRRNF